MALLSAMQTAEKNILEQEGYLQGGYRDLRHIAITAESFDLMLGFETLKPL